jgi:hypothetical protein
MKNLISGSRGSGLEDLEGCTECLVYLQPVDAYATGRVEEIVMICNFLSLSLFYEETQPAIDVPQVIHESADDAFQTFHVYQVFVSQLVNFVFILRYLLVSLLFSLLELISHLFYLIRQPLDFLFQFVSLDLILPLHTNSIFLKVDLQILQINIFLIEFFLKLDRFFFKFGILISQFSVIVFQVSQGFNYSILLINLLSLFFLTTMRFF